MLTLSLPPEIEARLDALAQRTGRRRVPMRTRQLSRTSKTWRTPLAEQRHRTDSGERISLDEMMEKYAADLKVGPQG